MRPFRFIERINFGMKSQNVRFESKRIFSFFSRTNPACPKNLFITKIWRFQQIICKTHSIRPGFDLQQSPRPRHKKQKDYVLEQSSFPLIALFWLKLGRCRGRNWLYGNQALLKNLSFERGYFLSESGHFDHFSHKMISIVFSSDKQAKHHMIIYWCY